MGSSTMDDWKRTALYLAALLAALHCRPGSSQCVQTFNFSGGGFATVEAGVRTCFRCLFGGAVDSNAMWNILDNNLPNPIDSSDGEVNDGVLTIYDPITIVPNTGSASSRTLRCDNSQSFQQYLIFLTRRGLVPPGIVSSTGTTTVNEGDSFRLTCDRSESDPVTGLRWLVNGSVIMSGQSSRLEVLIDTLVFTNILRNYSGEYNCTIQDDRNNDVSSAENIVVQFVPDVTTSVISPHLSPVNDTLILSCNYNAVPPPNITWLHEGSPLDPSDPRITITSTSSRSDLMRDDLGRGEGGTYTCNASNVVGSSSVDIEVTVQVPPDPPTIVMVTSINETSLGLSWVNGFNGNSDITGVRVDYTPDGGSTMSTTLPGDALLEFTTLGSLLPFRNYAIRVRVLNDVGVSGPGSTVGATLSLRLMPPTVTLSTPNSTTLVVDWQPPTVDPMTTDAIRSWEVEYMELGGMEMIQTVSDPSTTTLTLTVEKGTNYSVGVVGVNVRGRGNLSDIVPIRTPVDPPTMPRNLMVDGTGAFALNIEWDAPSDNGGSPVVRYTIEIREVVVNGTPADFTTLTPVTDTSAIQFRYEVRNDPSFPLSENTTYKVRVTAANSEAGQGPSSTAVGRTQSIGEPQRIFTAPGTVDITNMSVTVTWEFPGGYVDLYNIQYKRSNVEWISSTDVLNITVMGFRNEATINGLMPATMYNIRIRTLNVNGESEWSPEANFTTLPIVDIEGPSSGTTMAGEQVVLTCNVSPGVAITWSRQDNQSLPNPPEGNILRIPNPQPEDSGVYECLAGGVVAMFALMVEPPPTPVTTAPTQTMTTPTATPGGIGTVVIIAVSVGGGAALFIFLFVVVLAVVCLCRWRSQRSNSGIYNVKNRKLTWIETSNPNQFVPSTQPGASNGAETPAFDIPEDYQTHSSFNTLEKQNRIRRSRSPEDQAMGKDIAYTQLGHQQPVVSVHDAAPHRNVKQSNLVSSYEIGSPTSFQYIPQDPSATEWPDSQAPHYANTVV